MFKGVPVNHRLTMVKTFWLMVHWKTCLTTNTDLQHLIMDHSSSRPGSFGPRAASSSGNFRAQYTPKSTSEASSSDGITTRRSDAKTSEKTAPSAWATPLKTLSVGPTPSAAKPSAPSYPLPASSSSSSSTSTSSSSSSSSSWSFSSSSPSRSTSTPSSSSSTHKPSSVLSPIPSKPNPLVVHCKKSPYDVYIGRPGPWGNPFVIGKHGTRADVIRKYDEWLLSQPELVLQVKSTLKGRVLACWCSPEACHGDVLSRVANS